MEKTKKWLFFFEKLKMFDTVPPTHPSKKRPWTPPLDTASWHLTTPHSTRTPFHISTAHQQDTPSTTPHPHTSTNHRTHTHQFIDAPFACRSSFTLRKQSRRAQHTTQKTCTAPTLRADKLHISLCECSHDVFGTRSSGVVDCYSWCNLGGGGRKLQEKGFRWQHFQTACFAVSSECLCLLHSLGGPSCRRSRGSGA